MVLIEFTFNWRLEANLFFEKENVYINSPVYNCVYANCGYYWYVRFMECDPKRKDGKQRCFNLIYQNGSKSKVLVKVSVNLERTNTRSDYSKEFDICSCDKKETSLKEFEKSQGQVVLLFPANLTSEMISEFTDDKNMITVNCVLQFDEAEFNVRPYEPRISAAPVVGEKLFNAATSDSTESYYSDVVLLSKDGKRFRCHKSYLSAGCEIFLSIFKNNIDESIIRMKDLDSLMITELLRFIYTNQISVNISLFAHELVQAADRYKLNELKSHCEIAMFDYVCKNNAVLFLTVSDRFGLISVRDKAVSIIVDNFFDIQENEEWTNLKSEQPNLVDLVLKDSAARANVSIKVL